MPERLPPQITKVTVGDKLVLIRSFVECTVRYSKRRKAQVLATEGSDVLLGFSTPVRSFFGLVVSVKQPYSERYPHCRWVKRHYIISNCRKVDV